MILFSEAPRDSLIGLGWRASKDKRRFDFPLEAEEPKVSRRYWYSPGVLDQGATSACVGYSATDWLETGPIRNKRFTDPFTLYKRFQQHDEWPGEEPAYEGTSVNAAFKYLKLRGYIGEYRWSFSAETSIFHVLNKGPVLNGTIWTMDMFMPDRHGYIYPGGNIVGGHAYTIVGADMSRKNPDGTRGAARLKITWGKGFGQNGRVWITLGDLDELIKADGESGTAAEIIGID